MRRSDIKEVDIMEFYSVHWIKVTHVGPAHGNCVCELTDPKIYKLMCSQF